MATAYLEFGHAGDDRSTPVPVAVLPRQRHRRRDSRRTGRQGLYAEQPQTPVCAVDQHLGVDETNERTDEQMERPTGGGEGSRAG